MVKTQIPTKEQTAAMKAAGIDHPFMWSVVQDLRHSMIIKHRISGEFRLIDKE